ncbi:S8 family serine peptidase [Streptomyces sp. CHD11]|uniref:S8 family serine peptidase n=1 Tax=Streptomyces sp. CHD11 TaxID=2741325 RepID=UPI001BFC27FD|nr:S8 family serine peptidase [Streptomyces sp. CHD11]MBT3149329.1 S8 family serine peptidase [Streptomyces sp. CHD11]
MRRPQAFRTPPRIPGPRRRPSRWSRVAGVLAAATVWAVAVQEPTAAAHPAAPGLPAAAPAADGGATSLPPIPLALRTEDPCTGPSGRTAKGATWAQNSLSLPHAWRLSRGEGITVAVVGTGVSTTAPALGDRVSADGDSGTDCVGHGTFLAGLVAAARAEGTDFQGVAPAARILGVRGTDQRGAPSAERVAAGIRTAVDSGAQVVSVAAALPDGRKELTDAVREATEADVLVVAPAAPDVAPKRGDAPVEAYWPASAPGALSVIGVAADGTVLKSAAGADGADLAAPGGPVVGIGPRGDGHFIAAGSSAAAAFTAGAAALVRAYDPDLTAARTAERLIVSGAPTGDAALLDPYAAISLYSTGSRAPADPAAEGEPLRLPVVSTVLQDRALVLAGAMAMLVLVVSAAAVVIPRGRARGWRRP